MEDNRYRSDYIGGEFGYSRPTIGEMRELLDEGDGEETGLSLEKNNGTGFIGDTLSKVRKYFSKPKSQ